MKKQQIAIVILSLMMFLFGYCVPSFSVEELKDFFVYVDDEKQMFRTEVGKKIYPIEYNENIYIPINKTGSFLKYMTIESETALKLYSLNTDVSSKILKDLNTKTLENKPVTEDIFSNSDYTIIFVMATWCPDCKDSIVELEKFIYDTDLNYQILTVPIDIGLNFEEKLESEKQKDIENVKKMLQNIKNNSIIYTDRVLQNALIGNVVNIPKFVILDNEGNLIKIIEDSITSEGLEIVLKNIDT